MVSHISQSRWRQGLLVSSLLAFHRLKWFRKECIQFYPTNNHQVFFYNPGFPNIIFLIRRLFFTDYHCLKTMFDKLESFEHHNGWSKTNFSTIILKQQIHYKWPSHWTIHDEMLHQHHIFWNFANPMALFKYQLIVLEHFLQRKYSSMQDLKYAQQMESNGYAIIMLQLDVPVPCNLPHCLWSLAQHFEALHAWSLPSPDWQ